MGQWLIMKIRGYLEDHLFYLRTLTVCTVLSTGLLIYNQASSTSVGNTSGKSANLKVEREGSLPKVIGSGIMGHVQNSRTTSKNLVKKILVEPYSPSTRPQDEQTMKKQDNFFFTTF